MDNGDFKCKCGAIMEHIEDDFADLYCPNCEPECALHRETNDIE